jgi:hypothetical protein
LTPQKSSSMCVHFGMLSQPNKFLPNLVELIISLDPSPKKCSPMSLFNRILPHVCKLIVIILTWPIKQIIYLQCVHYTNVWKIIIYEKPINLSCKIYIAIRMMISPLFLEIWNFLSIFAIQMLSLTLKL